MFFLKFFTQTILWTHSPYPFLIEDLLVPQSDQHSHLSASLIPWWAHLPQKRKIMNKSDKRSLVPAVTTQPEPDVIIFQLELAISGDSRQTHHQWCEVGGVWCDTEEQSLSLCKWNKQFDDYRGEWGMVVRHVFFFSLRQWNGFFFFFGSTYLFPFTIPKRVSDPCSAATGMKCMIYLK